MAWWAPTTAREWLDTGVTAADQPRAQDPSRHLVLVIVPCFTSLVLASLSSCLLFIAPLYTLSYIAHFTILLRRPISRVISPQPQIFHGQPVVIMADSGRASFFLHVPGYSIICSSKQEVDNCHLSGSILFMHTSTMGGSPCRPVHIVTMRFQRANLHYQRPTLVLRPASSITDT